MAATQDHRAQICYRDAEVQLGSTGATTTVSGPGGMRYNGSAFQLLDASGQYDPRLVYQLTHTQLNDLVHAMSDGGPVLNGAYKVIQYAAGTIFVSSETWYTSSSQALPVIRHAFIYPSGSYLNPTNEIWNVYVPGTTTVARTVNDSIAYAGISEVSRTRSYS
jgi:hypothetical protein